MGNHQERLIEEILEHCREIARLEAEFELGQRAQVGEGGEIESAAHGVRRLLDYQRSRRQEAEKRESVLDEVQPLPPPPPLEIPPEGVAAMAPEPDPVTAEFPAFQEEPAPGQTEYESLPVYQQVAHQQEAPRGALASVRAAQEEPVGKAAQKNWEQALGTAWLLRIGGLLLLIGAAYGAMKLQAHVQPIHRVLGAYTLSAVLAVAGWFVAKKSELAGRGTLVIGMALAYFTSFAGYFIEYTKVFDAFVIPVALMIVFAGGIVVMAERWRLESLAAFGFLLGIVPALVSAPSSGEFALVALGVLSIAAGALLLRNEWVKLTAMALVVTYLSTAALWFLPGFVIKDGVVLAHLGALIFYHLIFTVAFMRWSRRYLARERAAVEAVEHDAAPAIEEEKLLPYSHAFAVVNSLGVTALAIFLLNFTGVFWLEVEWLLFGLAALELGRLAVPALRRGELGSFHAVMGFGLVTGGIVAAFDGLAESAVLAMQALALCIAASRSRQLAWLRPLSFVPAGLAVKEFDPTGIVSAADYATVMIPGGLLLASALPWECLFTSRPRVFGTPLLRGLEWLSGSGRSLVAAGMMAAAGFGYFTNEEAGLAAMAVLGTLLIAGVVVLAAETWLLSAAAMLGLSALISLGMESSSVGVLLLLPVCFLGAVYFWEEMAKRFRDRRHRIFQWIVFVPLGGLMAASVFQQTAPAGDWRWAILVGVGVASYGLFLAVPRCGRFPALVKLPGETEEVAEGLPELLLRYGRLSTMVALGLAAASVFTVLVLDAPRTLVPAMSMTAIGLVVWTVNKRREDRVTLIREVFFGALVLGVYTLCIFIHTKMSMPGLLSAVVGGGLFSAASCLRRMPASIILGFFQLTGLGLIAVLMPLQYPPETVFAELCGLGIAVILLAVSVYMGVVRRSAPPSRLPESFGEALKIASPVWTVLGAALALSMLANGALLSGTFVSVAWGVLGIVLLIEGFVFLDRTQRFVAIGVFGAAIVRVVIFDLAHSDDLTKVVAFCGLGLLLIVSGIGYGLLSRRLLREAGK